jgi:hypothetical protein
MPLATITMPAFPAVLQFPGVPALTGGFGASIGLGSGGVSVGISAGATTGLGSLAGNLAGTVSIGPGGLSASLSGSLSGGLSPFGLSLASSLPPLLTADQPGGMFQGPTWGIYDKDGQSIAPWETVVKVDYRHEFRIADFPIEGGGFASYNKVQIPYDIRISFAVGSRGGPPQRTQLLASLEAAVASLDFYTVVTPEATYPRANLTHMEYSRESRRGVNLLLVEVFVSEVRVADGAAFAEKPTKAPTGKPAKNSGQVTPKDVPFDVPPGGETMSGEPQPGSGPGPGTRAPLPQSMLPGEPQPLPASMPSKSAPELPGEYVPPPTRAINPPANAPTAVQVAPYKDLIF